jgi:hypothetical protein
MGAVAPGVCWCEVLYISLQYRFNQVQTRDRNTAKQ